MTYKLIKYIFESHHFRIIALFSISLLSLSCVLAQDTTGELNDRESVYQWQKQSLDGELSPDGNYIVAFSREINPQGGYSSASLLVWAVLEEDTSYPDPITVLNFDDPQEGLDFAVSPDEAYLALVTHEGLAILTFPQLTSYKFIAGNSFPMYLGKVVTAWSSNNNLVGALLGSEIVVFDIQSEELYRYDLGTQFDTNLIQTQNGWLLDYRYQNPSSSFRFCDWYLTRCDVHTFSDLSYVVNTPDGDVIFAISGSYEYSRLGVWVYGDNNSYVPSTDQIFRGEDICPLKFSNSGNYILTSHCFSDDRVIFEYPSMNAVQHLGSYSSVTWLANEDYFVSVPGPTSTLALYKTGQSEPLDEFPLYPETGLHTEFAYIAGIFPNGTSVLLGIDKAFVIIDIEIR